MGEIKSKIDWCTSELENQIKSNRSLIYITTHEEHRVDDAIQHISCNRAKPWSFVFWDIASGGFTNSSSFKMQQNLDQSDVLSWFKDLVIEKDDFCILVLHDFYKFLAPNSEPGQVEILTIRALRNLIEVCNTQRKCVIITGAKYFVPTEFEKLVCLLDWPLPEETIIQNLVVNGLNLTSKKTEFKNFRIKYTDSELNQIIQSFKGLTLREIEMILTYFILTEPELDHQKIASRKKDIIKKSGILEWVDLEIGLNEVGGLPSMKDWLLKRKDAFSDSAKKYGLPEPKGLLITGIQGGGKCFKKGTKVIMFDGSIKNVEDIKVNDVLMGPDSKPRKVLNLSNGYEQLYNINPIKGNPFTVTGNHILNIKHSGKRICLKGFDENGYMNISVLDYIKKTNAFKQRTKLWRTSVNFKKQDIPIDSYFLGVWLGDGTSSEIGITTENKEIEEYCYKIAKEYNLNINDNNKRGKAKYLYCGIKKGAGFGKFKNLNPIMEIFKNLNILNNKHIPECYLINDKEVRLELLAGIIDTDGYLHKNNYYEITQKNKQLADNIVYLARSLGFGVYQTKVNKKCYNNGKIGTYYNISITGNVNKIPCKIEYKKAKKRKQIKNVLVTGFEITEDIIDKFYGFEVDKDHLFLLDDFTVVHNSRVAKAIASYWGLPLLRLDVGRIFSSLVGSSEENLRFIIKLAESIAPCVLWADELEKGFSSTISSDSGTSSRVFGTFLTWLQEKKSAVFVVATANDISNLPPELIRKGRFDEIFFVDLPDDDERAEIWNIHLKQRSLTQEFDLKLLIKESNGFTGAEIEAAIIAAMYEGFSDNKRQISTVDILKELKQSIPISITMKERIDSLRLWATQRARNASKNKAFVPPKNIIEKSVIKITPRDDSEEEL